MKEVENDIQLHTGIYSMEFDRQMELDRYINDPCIVRNVGNIALSAQEIDGLGNN